MRKFKFVIPILLLVVLVLLGASCEKKGADKNKSSAPPTEGAWIASDFSQEDVEVSGNLDGVTWTRYFAEKVPIEKNGQLLLSVELPEKSVVVIGPAIREREPGSGARWNCIRIDSAGWCNEGGDCDWYAFDKSGDELKYDTNYLARSTDSEKFFWEEPGFYDYKEQDNPVHVYIFDEPGRIDYYCGICWSTWGNVHPSTCDVHFYITQDEPEFLYEKEE